MWCKQGSVSGKVEGRDRCATLNAESAATNGHCQGSLRQIVAPVKEPLMHGFAGLFLCETTLESGNCAVNSPICRLKPCKNLCTPARRAHWRDP